VGEAVREEVDKIMLEKEESEKTGGIKREQRAKYM
jgi:hypothetical protein